MNNNGNHLYSHLSGADGMRALACLAVIFHHIAQRLAMQQQPGWVREIQSLMLAGNAGVSVFFVLSGFLLSYPFWRNYLGQKGLPDIRHYLFRRAARIVPGYYLVFLVCMTLVLLLEIPSEHFWLRVTAGLTFTSAFHYVTFFPSDVNGPLWSIGFEVFCYALMPLFMAGLFVMGKKRSFPKSMGYWIIVLLFIFALNQLAHYLLTPGNDQRGWQYGLIGGAKYWMPNYNPIGFFGHFAVGILAAGVTTRLQLPSVKITKFERAGGFDFLGVAGLLFSFLLLWILRKSPEFSVSWQNQPYFFPYFAILISIPLVTAPHSIFLRKLLDNVFFRFTAKVSFGLYLWHHLIITITAMYWAKDYQYMGIANLERWATLSMTIFGLSYIVALISYYLIEKPVLDWAQTRGKRQLIPIQPD
ncbi:Peptidoglycan/LPS O-acetylase OafA/YrhL, contains acyltransferase and SGNH-hydrolase domains [Paenibacillus sp. yr247]|uniref:acyltransferase family protein n=1 Tax=Paenibacillus sp. yr247 TaxID=1761880 RepID=UPI0008906F54|nr:acyltransferase [Paenibacillus sp. yr247]SDO74314.1 Peptidoglycan/LPS O-acetylase OafA/YrhL, contains acyltransferase and SGNH-hydrolase domains [Paenibacillus sp. yr247]